MNKFTEDYCRELLSIAAGEELSDVKIDHAFRLASRQVHPDKLTRLSEDEREAKTQQFHQLKEAKERLKRGTFELELNFNIPVVIGNLISNPNNREYQKSALAALGEYIARVEENLTYAHEISGQELESAYRHLTDLEGVFQHVNQRSGGVMGRGAFNNKYNQVLDLRERITNMTLFRFGPKMQHYQSRFLDRLGQQFNAVGGNRDHLRGYNPKTNEAFIARSSTTVIEEKPDPYFTFMIDLPMQNNSGEEIHPQAIREWVAEQGMRAIMLQDGLSRKLAIVVPAEQLDQDRYHSFVSQGGVLGEIEGYMETLAREYYAERGVDMSKYYAANLAIENAAQEEASPAEPVAGEARPERAYEDEAATGAREEKDGAIVSQSDTSQTITQHAGRAGSLSTVVFGRLKRAVGRDNKPDKLHAAMLLADLESGRRPLDVQYGQGPRNAMLGGRLRELASKVLTRDDSRVDTALGREITNQIVPRSPRQAEDAGLNSPRP